MRRAPKFEGMVLMVLAGELSLSLKELASTPDAKMHLAVDVID